MAKSKFFSTSSKVAAALTVGMMGVSAQDALAQSGEEEIVVTGSNIRGTPEDAALPVDVISAQQLQEQGSPTVVQLVRTITAAGASFGEGYRFAGAPPGAATFNLRGLGSQRNLVLMNGRRFAPSVALGSGNAVDLNMLPQSAIGRVEILRDGAAAVYGSDAVGGVVNFITRRDLEGFEVDTEYAAIDGSDGDYRANGAWGWQGDRGNILIAGGYRHRSQLRTLDRDWAVRPYAGLPSSGGWAAAGNPGTYLINTTGELLDLLPNGALDPTTHAFTEWNSTGVDPGCEAAGGQRIGVITNSTTCQFQFSRFENLTNPEDNYHLYSEVNFELADNLDLHAELAWFKYDSEQNASPMNQTAQFPAPIEATGASAGGGVSPYPAGAGQFFTRYYIPPEHPGLQALFGNAANCTNVGPMFSAAECAGALELGVITAPSNWRAAGPGGNLLREGGHDLQSNTNDGFRVSASLDGMLPWNIHWNGGLTWTDTSRSVRLYDQSINRLQLALRGLGGPNCDPDTDTPFAGDCGYWNPFANSLGTYTGTVPTPQTTTAGLQNSRAIAEWMTILLKSDTIVQNLTGDFVLDGSLPIQLAGGPIQWAAGVQYRYDREAYSTNQAYDINVTGCPDSPPYGDGTPTCDNSGSTIFFVGNSPYDVDRITGAVYAEVRLPVLDTFEVSAAIRHERFSGLETTDPRISARWQALDFLAFRSSWGTTFRAPPQSLLIEEGTRGLTNFTAIGIYRPTDLFGNPDLQPESAETYSLGFIVDAGNFRFSADYFDYTFEDEITTESATGILTAMTTAAAAAGFCESAAAIDVELRSRAIFASGCRDGSDVAGGGHAAGFSASTNFLGLSRYNWINGGAIEISGVDFAGTYDFEDVFGGSLTLGLDGTWLQEWNRGALRSPFLPGITIQAPIDRMGRADGLVFFYSYPEWKANASVNYSRGPVNARYMARYTHGVDDVAFGVGSPLAIDSTLIHDFVLQVDLSEHLPASPTLTFAVINLTDEDPAWDPRTQYNYVPLATDIVGRQVEIGLRARF